MLMKHIRGYMAIILFSLLAPCLAVTLSGAGATFPYPIYSKWFDMYHDQTGVIFDYQAIGSRGGVEQLKKRQVDFGASDAPLDNPTLKSLPGEVLQVPTVGGAIAVIYNLPEADAAKKPLRLTGELLAGIYLGYITRWNDRRLVALNPQVPLPNREITVAHHSYGNGASYIFTRYLSMVSPLWKQRVGFGKTVNWPGGIGGKGCDGVAGVVKGTLGAIGFVEAAYSVTNRIPCAALRNRVGQFVRPSTTGVQNAMAASLPALKHDIRASIVNAPGTDSYPLCGLTYLVFYKEQADPAKTKALLEFLDWTQGEGQSHAARLNYAPLPVTIRTLNKEHLRQVLLNKSPKGNRHEQR